MTEHVVMLLTLINALINLWRKKLYKIKYLKKRPGNYHYRKCNKCKPLFDSHLKLVIIEWEKIEAENIAKCVIISIL